jgi:predicted acyltransferase
MANTTASATGRLLSIDALRGFDMFWIVGGEHIFKALGQWIDTKTEQKWHIAKFVDEQLDHVPWEGFCFYDLIFPLFVFVVGVVLPFSIGKMRQRGEPLGRIYLRILRRAVLLYVLGLLYYHILQLDFVNQRYVGVLQRIALCYGFAAVVTLNTGWRTQLGLLIALLVGYWAILAFVAPPGGVAGDYTVEGNLAGYLDRKYLNRTFAGIYGSVDGVHGYGDNEGILSTIPAFGTALLGVLAGQWLLSAQAPGRKVLGLALAGVLCLGVGYGWSFWFPIIKNIWTSTFVLFAGGWSLLLLALFYGIIDGLGWRAWSFFFVVIGANAITIYMLEGIVDFEKIARFFLGGVIRHTGDFAPVMLPIGVVIVEWLLLLYLYRKRIFLRV